MGVDMYPEGYQGKKEASDKIDNLQNRVEKLLGLVTQMAEANARLEKKVDELSYQLRDAMNGRGRSL